MFRAPFGLLSIAFALVVAGFAVAGLLLDIPIFVIAIGLIVVSGMAFWWVTRERATPQPPLAATPIKTDTPTTRDPSKPDKKH